MIKEGKRNEPVSLDRNIVFKEKVTKKEKKQSKIPKIHMFAGIGVILLIIVLFINPENGEYIDSPPPEEQALRDSIYEAIEDINVYEFMYDSLPSPSDILLPTGLTYEIEDDLSWSIETETGLYYTSDMEPELFKQGEI